MINDDILKLDNQLCFAIYACSKEITRLYRPFLDQFGLTYTQYITLLALWEKDDITVKELGERLYLDSGTLTPLLKKMEENRLLVRQRSSEDERKVIIKLTEKARELKKDILSVPSKILCSTGLSSEEAVELRESINKLLKTIYNFNEGL